MQGVALRSMKAPGTAYDDPRLGKDPQPADMSGYVDTTDDNGGVHINSGIPNRAFYLAAAAIGGHAWAAPGQIWYDVLTGPGITPDCDFATFAALTVAAAVRATAPARPRPIAVAGGLAAPSASRFPGPRRPSPTGGARVPGRRPSRRPDLAVRRTGGFAGLVRERSRAARGAARGRRGALARPAGRRPAGPAGRAPAHPDAFCYGVRCAAPAST